MAVEVIEFDKNNPQDNFKYMAKNMDGEYEVGYIVVKQSWCSNPRDWTYYIVKNKYGSGGFCGGASDLGFEKIIVDPTTIEPYTQIAQIKFNQSIGMGTILVKDFLGDSNDSENVVAVIGANDELPYRLWQ